MNRTYHSLKLFYSKELKQEADRLDQSPARTYHCAEAFFLDKLHVLFSRRKIAEWLGYVFLIAAIASFFSESPPHYVYISATVSLAAFIRRFYYVEQYITCSRSMNMGLSLLKADMNRKYNLEMKP